MGGGGLRGCASGGGEMRRDGVSMGQRLAMGPLVTSTRLTFRNARPAWRDGAAWVIGVAEACRRVG